MKVLAVILALVFPLTAAAGDDCDAIAVWRDGRADGSVCRADAASRGLVILDLGEDWTPTVMALGPAGPGPSYRATFLALAQERFTDAGDDGVLATSDRYLELFGIPPSVGVVRARLADQTRHGCHARAGLHVTTARAAYAHLACDKLPPNATGVAAFQRGAMILPSGRLDAQTYDALALTSSERAFRTALRVLRERVVAATGLVEDGTAGGGEGRVLGRALEPEQTWRTRGHAPLPDAAPDLISEATEAAARALGWLDAKRALAAIDQQARARYVAVPLPARPAYHASLQIAIEIDRGDVWVDAKPRWRDVARRPALIVYAIDRERRIPLARWPTTIGGWQAQQVEGDVLRTWMESPAGARIWRDLVVGPRWFPPASTPDDELVRRTSAGYVLARELFGPSYRAAFGMLAFVHLDAALHDQEIRTHATGNLLSLAAGVSHGCHRLLGVHAVRLAGFVIAHHGIVRHGEADTFYRRVVNYRGQFPLAIDSQGYRIELVPPIPVDVLPGRVHR